MYIIWDTDNGKSYIEILSRIFGGVNIIDIFETHLKVRLPGTTVSV